MPFSLSFFIFPSFLSSFFLSFSSFSVFLPCSFFVRFVLSSCRFPSVSCIAFFAFLFASLLSLVADSVILLFRLGATPPPSAPGEPHACAFPLRAVFLLALLMLSYLFFSSLPAHFRFRFGHRLFSSCLFLVGSMLSPRFRFLLRLV